MKAKTQMYINNNHYLRSHSYTNFSINYNLMTNMKNLMTKLYKIEIKKSNKYHNKSKQIILILKMKNYQKNNMKNKRNY